MAPLASCFPWTYVGGVSLHLYPWNYISLCAFDELRVSKVAFSGDEIRRDYEAGLKHEPLAQPAGTNAAVEPLRPITRIAAAFGRAQRRSAYNRPPTYHLEKEARPLDALGPTDWFHAQWPTDALIATPRYPSCHVAPIAAHEVGVTLRRDFPLVERVVEPAVTLSLETSAGKTPFYTGTDASQIAYRTGNLLKLVDTSAPVQRSLEMIVVTHRLILARIKLCGAEDCQLRLDCRHGCGTRSGDA